MRHRFIKKIHPPSNDIFLLDAGICGIRFDFAPTEISFPVKEQAMDLSRRKPR